MQKVLMFVLNIFLKFFQSFLKTNLLRTKIDYFLFIEEQKLLIFMYVI